MLSSQHSEGVSMPTAPQKPASSRDVVGRIFAALGVAVDDVKVPLMLVAALVFILALYFLREILIPAAVALLLTFVLRPTVVILSAAIDYCFSCCGVARCRRTQGCDCFSEPRADCVRRCPCCFRFRRRRRRLDAPPDPKSPGVGGAAMPPTMAIARASETVSVSVASPLLARGDSAQPVFVASAAAESGSTTAPPASVPPPSDFRFRGAGTSSATAAAAPSRGQGPLASVPLASEEDSVKDEEEVGTDLVCCCTPPDEPADRGAQARKRFDAGVGKGGVAPGARISAVTSHWPSLSRVISVVVTLSLVVAVISLAALIVADTLSSFQRDHGAEYGARAEASMRALVAWLRTHLHLDASPLLTSVQALHREFLSTTSLLSLANAFLAIAVTLLLLLYLLLDERFDDPPLSALWSEGKSGAAAAAPHPTPADVMWSLINRSIHQYVVAKTAVSFVMGLLVWVALGPVLHVQLAHLFGVLTFVLNFIPSVVRGCCRGLERLMRSLAHAASSCCSHKHAGSPRGHRRSAACHLPRPGAHARRASRGRGPSPRRPRYRRRCARAGGLRLAAAAPPRRRSAGARRLVCALGHPRSRPRSADHVRSVHRAQERGRPCGDCRRCRGPVAPPRSLLCPLL